MGKQELIDNILDRAAEVQNVASRYGDPEAYSAGADELNEEFEAYFLAGMPVKMTAEQILDMRSRGSGDDPSFGVGKGVAFGRLRGFAVLGVEDAEVDTFASEITVAMLVGRTLINGWNHTYMVPVEDSRAVDLSDVVDAKVKAELEKVVNRVDIPDLSRVSDIMRGLGESAAHNACDYLNAIATPRQFAALVSGGRAYSPPSGKDIYGGSTRVSFRIGPYDWFGFSKSKNTTDTFSIMQHGPYGLQAIDISKSGEFGAFSPYLRT